MYINVADISADVLNDIPLSSTTQDSAALTVSRSALPQKGLSSVHIIQHVYVLLPSAGACGQ